MTKLTDREIREKLVTRGAETLSDAELLSLIVEGVPGSSSIELAERILKAHGSLAGLSKTELAKLRVTEGLGMKRAAVLSAVFELGARIRRQDSAAPSVVVTKDDVVALMEPHLAHLKHEEMWALYLTSSNGIIEKNKVSQGGVAALIVDYKLIVKRAVELLASSMIIVHNHPSGTLSPSVEDIEITGRVAEAAALFDIRLIDHIIISGNGAYSFRQNNLVR